MREQRRLAAIVSADVAGYSRLMGRDESGTLSALKALRQEVVDPAIASHGGRIVKTTGDGLLLEFPSVVNAVRCAVDVQMAMAVRTAGIADDRRIAFRIGINLGDIIIDGDDIFGDGVNVAARLQEIAAPGGVCVSSRVHDDVRDRLETVFEDGGVQTLKNIARPVQVWRWQPGAMARPEPVPAQAALPLPDKPSIAVLPFQNMSGDPEQEYFVDGMVEDIITALSQTKALFVIARNSSFSYKGKSPDIRQVGKELGVRYVLEGSLRKVGARVRITGQLIDAQSGAHLWAGRFDSTLEDIFELQDQVTSRVVAAIAPALEQAEAERSGRKSTESLAAYDYSLRGWACVNALTKDDNEKAIVYLTRAVELDDTFALAWAQKASCYVQRQSWRWTRDPEAEAVEAERCARRALALNGNDPRVLALSGTVLASVAGYGDEGLALLEKATDLDANLALAWHQRGQWCVRLGKPAIAHFERALRLNPRDLRAPMMLAALAFACLFEGDGAGSVQHSRAALRQMPNFPPAMLAAIAALANAGDIDEAREVLAAFSRVHPNPRISTVLDRSHLPRNQAILAAAYQRAGLPE